MNELVIKLVTENLEARKAELSKIDLLLQESAEKLAAYEEVKVQIEEMGDINGRKDQLISEIAEIEAVLFQPVHVEEEIIEEVIHAEEEISG